MKKILLELEFDGTAYHGWQVQKNGISIQSRVQDALEQCIGKRPNVTGCSRTDAGVHARNFCCVFETDSSIPTDRFAAALNVRLPDDIAVLCAREVPASFHPRYSAQGKQYVYRILNTPIRRPLDNKRSWHITSPLSADIMNQSAQIWIGTHDFSAYCAAGSSVQDKIRTISACHVKRIANHIEFTVCADGFLYHMVRIMAGTLVDTHLGRIEKDAAQCALNSGERSILGRTAPACGLYLDRVFYREEDLLCPKNEK